MLAAWCVFAWGAARLLIVHAELPRADVAVVLGGSSAYEERTRWAAQFWSAGRATEIIVTNDGQRGGWSNAEQRNPFFVERAVAELERAGVPRASVVVLSELVTGTHDEAILIRRYVEDRKLRSVLIVTSPYHSRRALWTMRKVFAGSGVKIGLVTPPPGQQTPAPTTWWLHVRGWSTVAGEYVKLVYYWRFH
ncbi:MAG: YdcF family protein [Pyrinomonadaceae bacterium]|nr:YdcF family protein [Pyrinomonadaceae bacterium]